MAINLKKKNIAEDKPILSCLKATECIRELTRLIEAHDNEFQISRILDNSKCLIGSFVSRTTRR